MQADNLFFPPYRSVTSPVRSRSGFSLEAVCLFRHLSPRDWCSHFSPFLHTQELSKKYRELRHFPYSSCAPSGSVPDLLWLSPSVTLCCWMCRQPTQTPASTLSLYSFFSGACLNFKSSLLCLLAFCIQLHNWSCCLRSHCLRPPLA